MKRPYDGKERDMVSAELSEEDFLLEMYKNTDGYFAVVPEEKVVLKVSEAIFDDAIGVDFLQDMGIPPNGKKYKTGVGAVNGQEYEFEEFTGDVITKFMYDKDDQLRYIVVESWDGSEEPLVLKVNELKKGVEESKFASPAGYATEDMSESDDWYFDDDYDYDEYEDFYEDMYELS